MQATAESPAFGTANPGRHRNPLAFHWTAPLTPMCLTHGDDETALTAAGLRCFERESLLSLLFWKGNMTVNARPLVSNVLWLWNAALASWTGFETLCSWTMARLNARAHLLARTDCSKPKVFGSNATLTRRSERIST